MLCVCARACVRIAASAAQPFRLQLLKPLLGDSAGPSRSHVVRCRGVNRQVQEDVKEDTCQRKDQSDPT